MIDQVRERPNWLKGYYKDNMVLMKLTPNEVLEITINSLNTGDQYRLDIDKDYVSARTQFTNIFEQPSDILICFIHNFKDAIIEEGCLSINYEFLTSRHIVKNFSFKLAKVEMSPLELAYSKMENMKQFFTTELGEKQKIIKQLETKLKANDEKSKRALQSMLKKITILIQKSKNSAKISADQMDKQAQMFRSFHILYHFHFHFPHGRQLSLFNLKIKISMSEERLFLLSISEKRP